MKFVFKPARGKGAAGGTAVDSLVSPGCIVSGGIVRSSVLSYNVMVRSWAEVDESVIMDNVEVGRHCRIKKAIIDKHNVIPPYTEIGIDPAEDRKRFTVTPRESSSFPRAIFRRNRCRTPPMRLKLPGCPVCSFSHIVAGKRSFPGLRSSPGNLRGRRSLVGG